jgi:hypothetical protein
MLPRGSRLILATAAVLLTVHACVWLGGAMSEAAIAFCAFALMIAGPIFILAWFGSLSELDERRRARQRQVDNQKSDALLWQKTLQELQPSARAYVHRPSSSANDPNNSDGGFAHRAFASVASALAAWGSEGRRLTRPILALCVTVASVLGVAGCGVPPEAWAAVRPGMGTKDLVALVGGPDYVRSNGNVEVWQYCRDFPGRDEGRYARYYTAVIVDKREVRDVQPYPALSAAGCEDYYRADF